MTAALTTSNATNKVTAEAGEGAEITLTINGEEATNGGTVTWLAGGNTVTVYVDGTEFSATVTKE